MVTLEELLEEEAGKYPISNSTYTLPIESQSDIREVGKALGVYFTTVYTMRKHLPKHFEKDSLKIRDLVKLVIEYVKENKRSSEPETKLRRLSKFLDNITAYHNEVTASGDGKGEGIEASLPSSSEESAVPKKTLHQRLEEKAGEYEVSRSNYVLPIRGMSEMEEIGKVLGMGNLSDIYRIRNNFPGYFENDSLEIKNLVRLAIDYVEQMGKPSKPEAKVRRLTKFLDNIAVYDRDVIKSGEHTVPKKTLRQLLEEEAGKYDVSRSTYVLPRAYQSDMGDIIKALGMARVTVYKMRRDFPEHLDKDSLEIKGLVNFAIDYVEQVNRPLRPIKKLELLTKLLGNITAYHNEVIKSGDGKGEGIETIVDVSRPEDVLETKYSVPEEYKYVHIYMGEFKKILDLSKYQGRNFARDTGIFTGKARNKKALLTDIVRTTEERGELTDEKYQKLLEQAVISLMSSARKSRYERKPIRPYRPRLPPTPEQTREKIEYDPRHVFSYTPSGESEFARQLKDIKEGAFVYHAFMGKDGKGEVGTYKGKVIKEGVERVVIHSPTMGEQEFLVKQKPDSVHTDWKKDIPIPEGIRLPDGTIYSSKSDSTADATKKKVVQAATVSPEPSPDLEQIAQGSAVAETGVEAVQTQAYGGFDGIDEILAKRYTPKEIGKLFGYEDKKTMEKALARLEKKGSLVPSEDGNYSGEDLVGFAFKSGKAVVFRQSERYKGDDKEVLIAAGRDLETITGGNKKTIVQRVEATITESKYEFYGEHGVAYEALVRQHLPGDDIALKLTAELTKGEIDWNRAGQELPKLFRVPDDKIFDTLELLAGKEIATQTDTGYILNTSVLTPS